MTKAQQSERDEFIAKLRETLKPGDTLYTVLRSVSRSGMSRVIDVYHFTTGDDGKLSKSWLSYWIAKACGLSFQRGECRKPEGIKIGGCGMDMGFHIVHTLARTLYPDGFGVELIYPNGSRGRGNTPAMAAKAIEHGATCYGRNGTNSGWDTDGGYALHQEWL